MDETTLKNMLEIALAEISADLESTVDGVAAYAAQRMAVLATLVGQPGYEEAVIAERDNVAMFAGIGAVDTADAAAQRLLGIVQGVLSLGAQLLANA